MASFEKYINQWGLQVVSKLHAVKKKPRFTLVSLSEWFKTLWNASSQYGGVFSKTAVIAQELLKFPEDRSILHGDIHHGNILDFGKKGWLAIDPKGLIGERYYDYANIFLNPNAEIALAPGRLEQQVWIVSEAAGLDAIRLKQWILAYAGLSATWHLEDGTNPELALEVAKSIMQLV